MSDKDYNIEAGKRLRDLRKLHNMTQSDVAKKLGVTHPTIVRYEKGDVGSMKTTVISQLAEIFHVSPLYVLGMDLEDFDIEPISRVKKIPILGNICAGDGIWCEENLSGFFFADESLKNADFIVSVDGDSMSGDNIRDGDKAFMKSTHYVDNGKIAAVLLKSTNEVMLKRVYVKEDHAILQPSNPTYSPITTDNFLILGELVGIYHKVE